MSLLLYNGEFAFQMLRVHWFLFQIKLGSREEARDGIHRTALREVKLMQEVHHINLLSLLDVFGYKSDVSLVFDFMDTDLEVIIKDTEHIVLTPANIKSYMIQTLRGLEFLHEHWILHRVSWSYLCPLYYFPGGSEYITGTGFG